MQPTRRQPMSQQQARTGRAVWSGQHIQSGPRPHSAHPLVPTIPGEQILAQQNVGLPRTSSTHGNSQGDDDPNATESLPDNDSQENILPTESTESLPAYNDQENIPPVESNMRASVYRLSYGNMSRTEKFRRLQTYRIAKYLEGDVAAYQGRPPISELEALRLPRSGQWSGIHSMFEEAKWRVATRDRFRPHERMIVPPAVRNVDSKGRLTNARKQNAMAIRWPKRPGINEKRSVNKAAKLLHPTGLRFRRILGHGGYGVAALFEAVMPQKPEETLQFVAKAMLDPDPGEEEGAFSEEKKMLYLLEGAQHIVQPMKASLLRDTSAPRKNRITARTYTKVDRDDNLVLTEYMSMGSLLGLLGRLTKIDHYMPNRALWHLLSCVIHACMALKLPPGKYKNEWKKYRMEERRKARAEKKPMPTLLTERVPPEDGLPRGNTIVHFDIDPQNILMKSNVEGHNIPIFKLHDFGLADFANDGDNTDEITLHRHRTRAKEGFLTPEQFTEEWDYHDVNPLYDDLGDNFVAGNYDSTTNIWQMGLIMQCAIVREWPLCPPITQLCEVHPEGTVTLDGNSARQDQDDDPADHILRELEFDIYEDDENEQHMDHPIYNPETNSGFLWTYATQLLRDREIRKRTEPRLVYCVCRMLAHRPADRISLTELKAIVDEMLTEVPQYGLDDNNIEEGRDLDYYDDQYLQIWINMLYSGVPTFNVMLEEGHEDTPYRMDPVNEDELQMQIN